VLELIFSGRGLHRVSLAEPSGCQPNDEDGLQCVACLMGAADGGDFLEKRLHAMNAGLSFGSSNCSCL